MGAFSSYVICIENRFSMSWMARGRWSTSRSPCQSHGMPWQSCLYSSSPLPVFLRTNTVLYRNLSVAVPPLLPLTCVLSWPCAPSSIRAYLYRDGERAQDALQNACHDSLIRACGNLCRPCMHRRFYTRFGQCDASIALVSTK
jgi:hypothetical protein